MNTSVTTIGYIAGKEVNLISITNNRGCQIQITNFGGIVHSWSTPDKYNIFADILLGCADLNDYQKRHPYFGAIIGRYANRIANGLFELNNTIFRLEKNLPPHHLHGGLHGFDRKLWEFDLHSHPEKCELILKTQSAHMEEGYPGLLDLKVIYTYNNDNELIMEYFATTDQDTHINLTNHCYFNLSGDQSKNILNHEVKISAQFYTESDDELIPTGKMASVKNTSLDFLQFRSISDRNFKDDDLLKVTNGYDHNYVITPHDFNSPIAEVLHQHSGRRLQVFTDQPAIQFYSGNWLDGVEGKIGKYAAYAGFCLETQHFPDSPNHPEFPSTRIKKGQNFYSKTIYKVDVYTP